MGVRGYATAHARHKGRGRALLAAERGLFCASFPTQHHSDTDGGRGTTLTGTAGDRVRLSPATASVLAAAPGEDAALAAGKTAHAGGQGAGICRWTVLHRP